jgi:hypothetical protein
MACPWWRWDGRIVLGEESNALREKLKSLIAEGKNKIVLNILVAAHCSAKTQGASLLRCHRQQVQRSAADHQAADGIRSLRYGSSRCRQFLKMSAVRVGPTLPYLV